MSFTGYERIVRATECEAWPCGRSGHRMCSDGNFLYVYGGYNPCDDKRTYCDLWRYNTTTSKWTLMPVNGTLSPKSSASSSMILWGNSIFVFGGTGYPFALNNYNDLFMYNLKSQKWFDLTKIATDRKMGRQQHQAYQGSKIKAAKSCNCQRIRDSPPTQKYGQSMTISPDEKLFVFSGTTGQAFLQEFHSFCLKKLYWTEYKFCQKHSRHQPIARYRHEVVSFKNEFYVLGGSTLDNYFDFKNIQSFNYISKSWNTVTCKSSSKVNNVMEFPTPRKAHSCVAYADKLFMFAGVNFVCGSLSDCWMLDMTTCTWHKKKVRNFFLFFVFQIFGGDITYILTFQNVNLLNMKFDFS